jgi:hypothetical protein
MKKNILLAAFLFCYSMIVHAQWTTNGTVTTTINTVGINTNTTPVSAFQVNSATFKFVVGNAPGANLNYGTSYIGFNAARVGAGVPASTWQIDSDTFHNGAGVIYNDIFGNIYLAPLASTGTTARTLADLDIKNSIAFKVGANGICYAKAISVQTTGWPDYVFSKDYKLPALTELKSYIDTYQHLPEVPEAAKVEQDGLNLGEMNKLMLKKVEELTLYLIEKDKKITELSTQLSEQQRQIDAIKEKLADKK